MLIVWRVGILGSAWIVFCLVLKMYFFGPILWRNAFEANFYENPGPPKPSIFSMRLDMKK